MTIGCKDSHYFRNSQIFSLFLSLIRGRSAQRCRPSATRTATARPLFSLEDVEGFNTEDNCPDALHLFSSEILCRHSPACRHDANIHYQSFVDNAVTGQAAALGFSAEPCPRKAVYFGRNCMLLYHSPFTMRKRSQYCFL